MTEHDYMKALEHKLDAMLKLVIICSSLFLLLGTLTGFLLGWLVFGG